MQPFGALLEAFGGSDTDDLLVIGERKVGAAVRIAVAFTETIDQDVRILVAVVQDAGHRDDGTVDVEFCLQSVSVVAEGNEDFFEFVNGARHFKAKEIQPCGVDERHIADGLNSGLFITQLFDPGERPDVTVFIGDHGSVFRSLFENLLQVRHVFVDVIFERDDDALFRVFQQVSVAKTGIEDQFRQCFDVGHLKGDLVAPLVGLDRFPFDMDIGLFFKALEDGTIVRFCFGPGGIIGQRSEGGFFSQRELQRSGIDIQTARLGFCFRGRI